MASVYILYSNILKRFYTGSCKDLSYRIDQHLNKDFAGAFTTNAGDWTLFIFKDDLEYKQARLIEQHIKKMKSSAYSINLKRYPEMMEKLMQKYAPIAIGTGPGYRAGVIATLLLLRLFLIYSPLFIR
jgi:putative endonuclease